MAKSRFFKTTTLKQALRMGPRKFVQDYLFPAMRREHGLGFAMEVWKCNTAMQSAVGLDGIGSRPDPACNSVTCIGGTMQVILGVRAEETLAEVLGIPYEAQPGTGFNDADSLFYHWQTDRGPWFGLSKKFADAKTPAQKERIAERAVLAAIREGERLRKEQQ